MKRALAGIAAGLLGVGSLLPVVSVYASTQYPPINVEIQGQKYPAIVVNGNTMVLWGALELFETPYTYKGNGLFVIEGQNVQGVVYKGQTYLNWAQLAKPSVIANHVGSGWNFTRNWDDTSTDGYKLLVTVNTTEANPSDEVPIYMQTFTSDGKPLSNQKVVLDEKPIISGYGSSSETLLTDNTGTAFWMLGTLGKEAVDQSVVTWIDSNGVTHTKNISIDFKYPLSTGTPTPPDDQVVVTFPCRISSYQVLFSGTANGQNMNWQLDTGAMTPVINASDASKLHLPDLQDIQVEGVTGSSKAYLSEMNIVLGGKEFDNVTVIVDSSYQGTSLFGYSFFADGKYDLLISQKHDTISILK